MTTNEQTLHGQLEHIANELRDVARTASDNIAVGSRFYAAILTSSRTMVVVLDEYWKKLEVDAKEARKKETALFNKRFALKKKRKELTDKREDKVAEIAEAESRLSSARDNVEKAKDEEDRSDRDHAWTDALFDVFDDRVLAGTGVVGDALKYDEHRRELADIVMSCEKEVDVKTIEKEELEEQCMAIDVKIEMVERTITDIDGQIKIYAKWIEHFIPLRSVFRRVLFRSGYISTGEVHEDIAELLTLCRYVVPGGEHKIKKEVTALNVSSALIELIAYLIMQLAAA